MHFEALWGETVNREHIKHTDLKNVTDDFCMTTVCVVWTSCSRNEVVHCCSSDVLQGLKRVIHLADLRAKLFGKTSLVALVV